MLQASPREARRTDLKPDNLIDSFAPYWTVVFPIQAVRVGGGWMKLGGVHTGYFGLSLFRNCVTENIRIT